MRIKKLLISVLAMPVLLTAIPATVFASATKPYVMVQGRQLMVDTSGTGTNYQPYVIRGVGYSPTPIGRYSSDWGYYVSAANPNPSNLPNNMFADPAILTRDFSLLQSMNANTVRIWGGDNNLEVGGNQPVSEKTFENAFPLQAPAYGDGIYNWLVQNNYIVGGSVSINFKSSTAVNTFLSALNAEFTDPSEYNIILDVLQLAEYGDANPGRFPNMMTATTLTTAGNYGLKVIAGFWVEPFGVCNYSTGSCVYTLNTYNGDRNDPGLYAPSLNAPFDITNPYIANDILMRFENYVNTFKNNPNILFWAIGNENNLSFDPNNPDPHFNTTAQIQAWYKLVNKMAAAAHAIEGATYHPVAVVNGDDNFKFLGNSIYFADDTSLSNVDIWGVNIYRGLSFNNFFVQYKSLSQKPLWVSEYGVDAWQSCNTKIFGPAKCDPNNPSQGSEDDLDQAAWDGDLWNEIAGNADISIGGSVTEYSDEWWKPNDWICDSSPYNNYPLFDASIPLTDLADEAAYCHSHHFYFGEGYGSNWPPPSTVNPNSPLPPDATPDNYDNEAWYGLVGISNTSPETQPDTMNKRQAYMTLQGEFASNAALQSYLALPLQGTTLNSTSVTFAWSFGRGVAQYQLSIGTTQGGKNIYSYTGTATSATVLGVPLTGQALYVQLGSYINGAWQPAINYTYSTINNAIIASAGTGGVISPSGIVSVNAGANQSFAITANSGYYINQVLVDGQAVSLPGLVESYNYTFSNVTGAHTITASFNSDRTLSTLS